MDGLIVLYLLAAHLVGDFVLQTRWQAARKLDDASARTRHVVAYCLPFLPIALVYGDGPARTWLFMVLLAFLHGLTDSRRFHSTLGDWLAWRFVLTPAQKADDLQELVLRDLQIGDYHSPEALVAMRPSPEKAARARIPANPWAPIPLFVDQTLHICQLALLGGLLLK